MLSADVLVQRWSVLFSHFRFPCPHRGLCSVHVYQMHRYYVLFFEYVMALYIAEVTWR